MMLTQVPMVLHEKCHVASHVNHPVVRNGMLPLTMSLVLHDEKFKCSSFDHLHLMNVMVPSRTQLTKQDVDTCANGVA